MLKITRPFLLNFDHCHQNNFEAYDHLTLNYLERIVDLVVPKRLDVANDFKTTSIQQQFILFNIFMNVL